MVDTRLVIVVLAALIATARGANVLYGVTCAAASDVCTDTGTACIDDGSGSATKCLCDGDYVANAADDACVKKVGKACSTTPDCLAYGACTSSVCACGTGYVVNSDNTACLGNVGSTCAAAANCLANGACTSTLCACAANHHASSDNTICYKDFGQACTANTDCDSAQKALCDLNAASPLCKLGSGGDCSAGNSGNCLSNAACTSDVCTCSTGYMATDILLCSGAIDNLCSMDSHCAKSDNPTGTVCDLNASPAICAIGAGGDCSTVTTKCVSNSACTSNACACSATYTAALVKLCSKDLGEVCDDVSDCSGAPTGKVCDTTATTSTCALAVAATCTGNTDKCVTNAECTSTTCSCQTGFPVNGDFCNNGKMIMSSILLIAVSQLMFVL